MLLAGLTAGEAVGTAFLFAGVLRLIAAPFYLAGKQIHGRYLWLLLQGAVPGLLVGIALLRLIPMEGDNGAKFPSTSDVKMVDRGLGGSAIHAYTNVVKMVAASAINEQGEELSVGP